MQTDLTGVLVNKGSVDTVNIVIVYEDSTDYVTSSIKEGKCRPRFVEKKDQKLVRNMVRLVCVRVIYETSVS